MWESALADVADTAVFGKGLASFVANSRIFFPLPESTSQTYYRGEGFPAHNVYVQVFYETGAVGLFCYLMIYMNLFLRPPDATTKTTREDQSCWPQASSPT